jgi:drug/metabolite transporter (DMT)-like permease
MSGAEPTTMSGAQRASLIGSALTGVYVILSCAKAVYLGYLEQGVHPMLMLLGCFGLVTLFFNATQLGDLRRYTARIRASARDVLVLNVCTTGSWVGYFAALAFLEPAIAIAILIGIEPVATVIITRVSQPAAPRLRSDVVTALGILVIALFLGVITFRGDSGLGALSTWHGSVGIACAIAAGVASAFVVVVSRRLASAGMTASQVMGSRFGFLLLACAGYAAIAGLSLGPLVTHVGAVVAVAVVGLLVPLFALQKGLEHGDPIFFVMIDSLSPVIMLAMQAFDPRITFSPLSLAGSLAMVVIVAYGTIKRYRSLG